MSPGDAKPQRATAFQLSFRVEVAPVGDAEPRMSRQGWDQMEEEDDRLRYSRRPEAFTRICQGVAAADTVGWPVNVPAGLFDGDG
jgi:hypothetical protein